MLLLHINISRGKNASSAENVVNIPLSSDTQTAGDYLHVWDTIVMPKARNFDPDIILFDTVVGSRYRRIFGTPDISFTGLSKW